MQGFWGSWESWSALDAGLVVAMTMPGKRSWGKGVKVSKNAVMKVRGKNGLGMSLQRA